VNFFTIIINGFFLAANYRIRMNSEGSCDTRLV